MSLVDELRATAEATKQHEREEAETERSRRAKEERQYGESRGARIAETLIEDMREAALKKLDYVFKFMPESTSFRTGVEDGLKPFLAAHPGVHLSWVKGHIDGGSDGPSEDFTTLYICWCLAGEQRGRPYSCDRVF